MAAQPNWIGFFKAKIMGRSATELQAARDAVWSLMDPGAGFDMDRQHAHDAYQQAMEHLAKTGQLTYPEAIPDKR